MNTGILSGAVLYIKWRKMPKWDIISPDYLLKIIWAIAKGMWKRVKYIALLCVYIENCYKNITRQLKHLASISFLFFLWTYWLKISTIRLDCALGYTTGYDADWMWLNHVICIVTFYALPQLSWLCTHV